MKNTKMKSSQGGAEFKQKITTNFRGGAQEIYMKPTTSKKRCIPGFVCIENITLLVLIGIFMLILFLYNSHFSKMYNNTKPRIYNCNHYPIINNNIDNLDNIKINI